MSRFLIAFPAIALFLAFAPPTAAQLWSPLDTKPRPQTDTGPGAFNPKEYTITRTGKSRGRKFQTLSNASRKGGKGIARSKHDASMPAIQNIK